MGRPVDESLISQQVVLPSGVAALPSTRCSWEAVKGPEDFEAAEVHSSAGWDSLPGFDSQQLEVLQRAATKGVFWQHPTLQISRVFALHYGGDVDADGNCLFTAVKRAMQLSESPTQIRAQTVKKFLEDYHGSDAPRRDHVDSTIRNLYSPNLSSGWGVHVVQELKLLAKKADRTSLESEIDDFAQAGMTREAAMESVYNDRCIHVQDASSWAKYMSISGQSSDEYDIVTLLYTEEGLLSIETNPDGRAAAFGDDIAIEALASELGRQIFVVCTCLLVVAELRCRIRCKFMVKTLPRTTPKVYYSSSHTLRSRQKSGILHCFSSCEELAGVELVVITTSPCSRRRYPSLPKKKLASFCEFHIRFESSPIFFRPLYYHHQQCIISSNCYDSCTCNLCRFLN